MKLSVMSWHFSSNKHGVECTCVYYCKHFESIFVTKMLVNILFIHLFTLPCVTISINPKMRLLGILTNALLRSALTHVSLRI